TCRHCALSRIVIAPSYHSPVRLEGEAVSTATCNFCHITQIRWNVGCTKKISAPGHHRPTGRYCQTMKPARRNLNNITEGGGRSALTGRVVAENHQRPIGESQRVTGTGGNVPHPAEPGRNCALSERVLAPSDHVSVTFERHTMPIAHRDFCDAIQTWRNKDLPVSVFAPGKDGSIGFQREI